MKRWLGWPAVVAAIAAVAIVAAMHVRHAFPPDRYAMQRDFLKGEIAKLDAELNEVQNLRQMIFQFLSRKRIIETLERDRGRGVRLLNEITRQRPDGIRFVSIRQVRGTLTVEGVAASEQALRAFTAAVAASSVLQPPEVLVTRGSDFSFQTALRTVKEQ